jgi:glycosyltransferase involved in cell wall biosynthesis
MLLDKIQPRYGIYTYFIDHEPLMTNFLNNIKNADEIVLCDAGSTDGSEDIIKRFSAENPNLNIKIYRVFLSPWRFDDARNMGLSLMSRSVDLCLCLDIDEILVPDWRSILDSFYDPNIAGYEYYVEEEKDGASNVMTERRIHRIGGCYWKYPVYEELIFDDPQSLIMIPHVILKRSYRKPGHDTMRLLDRYIREQPGCWVPLWRLAQVCLESGNFREAHSAADKALKLKDCDYAKLYGLKAQIFTAEGLAEEALHYLTKAISYKNEIKLYIEKAHILSKLERHLEAYACLKEAACIRTFQNPPFIWDSKLDAFMASEKQLALEEMKS